MSTCETIRDNLKKAFPDSSFLVVQSENRAAIYQGFEIVDLKNNNGKTIEAYKMSKSTSGKSVTGDELKQQCFCWVFDSKNMTDKTARRDFLKSKIGAMFPDNHVSIFILNCNTWGYSSYDLKATCYYEKEYGNNDVLIILN